jgi:hypothetical protein
LQQMEESQRARVEAAAIKKEMLIFQKKYQERFQKLRGSLEEMYKKQERSSGQGQCSGSNHSNMVLDSDYLHRNRGDSAASSVSPATARQQIKTMEAQMRSLSQQLSKLQADSKKKDSQLKKYETFYKEVKARSAQRAAERQKDGSA